MIGSGDCMLLIMMVNMFLGVALVIYIAYVASRDLESIEAYLGRSSLVINNRRMLGNGLAARMFRLMQISSCLGMREFSIRKGHLDAKDASEFPSRLARKIVWLGRLLFIIFTVLVLVGGYGKYFNGYQN